MLQQTESGWWFVSINGEEGWAPSTFIEGRQKRSVVGKLNSGHGNFRESNSSIGSLDEETGEKNRKNVKPKIGSSNGAFTPFNPHESSSNSKRPLPTIPSEDSVEANSAGAQGQRKAAPPPIPSKPTKGGGVDALRQQLENKLGNGGATSSTPPPVPRKISQGGGGPPLLPASSRSKDQWITVASYDKENDTEIGFRKGTHVEVVEKDDSGWWMIRIGAEEGWAPSTYLEKI